jgi:hypothetical protein
MSPRPNARLSSTLTATQTRHGLALVRESSQPRGAEVQITLTPAAEAKLLALLLTRKDTLVAQSAPGMPGTFGDPGEGAWAASAVSPGGPGLISGPPLQGAAERP